MQLVDARRLTGPNLLARTPLVVVELALEPSESVEAACAAYGAELGRMRSALGLSPEVRLVVRPHAGGAVIGYEAPIDVMLPCVETSEWAALSAAALSAGGEALPLEPKREEIAAQLAAEKSPRLLALAAEAARRGVPLLWDDAEVSLGEGIRSATFERAALPDVNAVEWNALGTIPVAMVTGTNGKTTSTRLLARIACESGRAVGWASTEAIVVGGETVAEGDYTGPAAARAVLRRKDVDFAVLETARGGILRRGLAVDTCDVALVTNVSDDHLGLYGIDDVAAMTQVKAVVAEAAQTKGTVVLNAADAHTAPLGRRSAARVVLFADLDAVPSARSRMDTHLASGGRGLVAEGGWIVEPTPHGAERLAPVDALPVTLSGAARYNVENVLGAAASALALGLPKDAILRGISAFDASDNPGRGEVVRRGGVAVFLDFAHNPVAVRGALAAARSLLGGGGRLTVLTGSAGDRTDLELVGIARSIAEAAPARVLVRELHEHLRGRAVGEVPALLESALRRLGVAAERIAIVASEVDGLRAALDDARPGDVVALLVHLDRRDVREFLASADRAR